MISEVQALQSSMSTLTIRKTGEVSELRVVTITPDTILFTVEKPNGAYAELSLDEVAE